LQVTERDVACAQKHHPLYRRLRQLPNGYIYESSHGSAPCFGYSAGAPVTVGIVAYCARCSERKPKISTPRIARKVLHPLPEKTGRHTPKASTGGKRMTRRLRSAESHRIRSALVPDDRLGHLRPSASSISRPLFPSIPRFMFVWGFSLGSLACLLQLTGGIGHLIRAAGVRTPASA